MEVSAIARADEATPERSPELSPFCTAYIAEILADFGDASAREVVTRAVQFLENEEGRGGLWRYWCKDASLFSQIPPDVDDTACISNTLRKVTGSAPNNKKLLISNRNHQGLFYTWMIPRLKPVSNIRWWWIMLTGQTYGRAVTFWRSGAARGDIDSVVNANVLLYLGDIPETERVARWLRDIALAGEEEKTDRWYRSRPAFYYALSRCYSTGHAKLGDLATSLRRSFAEIAQPNGCIGGDILQTALALCAIENFDIPMDGYVASVRYLLEQQQDDGGWDWCPVYYDGRNQPVMSWGSRAVTSGFCLQALRIFSVKNSSASARSHVL